MSLEWRAEVKGQKLRATSFELRANQARVARSSRLEARSYFCNLTSYSDLC